MGKSDKKSEKKKAPKTAVAVPAAKSVNPVPALSKDILAKAHVTTVRNFRILDYLLFVIHNSTD